MSIEHHNRISDLEKEVEILREMIKETWRAAFYAGKKKGGALPSIRTIAEKIIDERQ